MNDLIFLSSFDNDDDDTNEPVVHLRLQKRNNRKCITIVEGITRPLVTTLLSDIRKSCNVNGTIKEEDVVQLQGDQREAVKEYLLKKGITINDNIHVHGI